MAGSMCWVESPAGVPKSSVCTTSCETNGKCYLREDNASDRTNREGSDFLLPTDHDGRVIDFHALRHTCGAWAASGGASPKAIQTLMRHSSIKLTLDTYGHLLPDEAAGQSNGCPTWDRARCARQAPQVTPPLAVTCGRAKHQQ